MRIKALSWVLLGVLLSAVGCAAPPYEITVELDQNLRKAESVPVVPVEFIGVSRSDYDRWSRMSVNRYFNREEQGGQTVRSGVKEVVLSKDRPEVVLAKNDPIWKEWKETGAAFVFVLSNYPRQNMPDIEGAGDPRRRILPLDQENWPGQEIRIRVRPDGLQVVTPQKERRR